MKKSLNGAVIADLIEVRFAYSGKVVSVRKKRGDAVKIWEGIASLDRKILQTELDRQLADYEKVRAQFEIFNIKYQAWRVNRWTQCDSVEQSGKDYRWRVVAIPFHHRSGRS